MGSTTSSLSSTTTAVSTATSTSIASVTASTTTTATATCSAVAAPAPTQTGIVSGCQLWHTAVSGDYCSLIASNYNISLNTFYAWNPAVGSSCASLYAGDAYCVGITCTAGGATTTSKSVSSTPAPTTFSTSTVSQTSTYATTCPAATATSTAHAGSDTYTKYSGDGSPGAGWPCMSSWVDFDSMWKNNQVLMNSSCSQYGVANDSPEEICGVKAAIQVISMLANVDQRFVLATIMQESNGCVRVPSTNGSHLNPGLMQSDQGTGTCNTGLNGAAGVVQTPCPAREITQMILDGTNGTGPGQYGLAQYLVIQGLPGAQGYYRTARSYNSGSVAANGNLSSGLGTPSYASDVANRLTGWVLAPSKFN